MDQRRLRILQPGKEKKGIVAYWMSRDQRAHDNWALLFAQEMSLAAHVPLDVMRSNAPPAAEEAFLEELIVRRELSDNFCFYNASYDFKKVATNTGLRDDFFVP